MTTRGLVRELLVSHMNSKRLNHVSIADFTTMYKAQLPKLDLYRIVYGIGLNCKGFRIENDGETTFVVMDN